MEKEIDTTDLEKEQKKLSKLIKLKDAVKMEDISLIAGCEATTLGNQVICAIAVMSKDFEIIEEKFVSRRAAFPYIAEFRAYRELPAMIECWEKLENAPDILMVNGHGICHPRGLGLASHFSLSIDKPTIGIASSLIKGEVKNGKIIIHGKITGEELITRQGSKPIYISPGNMISLETAVKIVKKFIREPHKLPEPLDAAHRYASKIKDELNVQSKA